MRRVAMLSVFLSVLFSSSAIAGMTAEPVEWTVGADTFSGVLVYDDASDDPRPGLVMVPNWMGVTEDAVARARAVAGDTRGAGGDVWKWDASRRTAAKRAGPRARCVAMTAAPCAHARRPRWTH